MFHSSFSLLTYSSFMMRGSLSSDSEPSAMGRYSSFEYCFASMKVMLAWKGTRRRVRKMREKFQVEHWERERVGSVGTSEQRSAQNLPLTIQGAVKPQMQLVITQTV